MTKGMAQVGENLPNKNKALSSSPSTTKKEKIPMVKLKQGSPQ
jgi:hypothetical protein